MSGKIAFNWLDPARTALVVAHMVKGVAGEVVTPFNQLFRKRAEQTGIIKTQVRLLDAFRTAKARVLYTAVTYRQGSPGSARILRCGALFSIVSA
jgi:nicotinamidase-related amidase